MAGAAEQAIWAFGDTAPFFGVYDYIDAHYWFRYNSSVNTGNGASSIVVESDGDLGFANNGMFFDRSATRLGIGTNAPAVDFQINDTRPEIRFLDESDGGTMDIVFDGPNFAIEGNTNQNIILLQETAPGNSIFVESTGDVGLGTGTPTDPLHVIGSSSAGIKLDTPYGDVEWQQWSNGMWFYTDLNNDGVREYPFRIAAGGAVSHEPSYGTLSIVGADKAGGGNDGFVGVGLANNTPDTKLHVLGNDSAGGESNTTALKLENTSSITANRFLLQMENNGAPGFFFRNTDSLDEWQFSALSTGDFTTSFIGTGGPEMVLRKNGELKIGPGGSQKFLLDPSGNGLFAGQVIANGVVLTSDRNQKQNFREISPSDVLAKVNQLDITRWNFKQLNPEVDHIGPMAQDFHAAFGLGADNKHISPMDMASVALAAVKGLQQELNVRDAEIASLRNQLNALNEQIVSLSDQQKRVDSLEASLKSLMDVLPQTGAMPVALKQGSVTAY